MIHSINKSITTRLTINESKSQQQNLNNHLFIKEQSLDDENQLTYTLVKSSPYTTTIAKVFEDTVESQLALQRQMPFNYLHNQMNNKIGDDRRDELSCSSSASSFTSSGYSSQIPVTRVVVNNKLMTPNDSSVSSSATNSLLKSKPKYSLNTLN